MSASIADGWRTGITKALEHQFRAFVPENVLKVANAVNKLRGAVIRRNRRGLPTKLGAEFTHHYLKLMEKNQKTDPGFCRPTTRLRMAPAGNRQHTFFGVSALMFACSTALTILSCRSMSAVGGMSMLGGWTMSMAWMRMPGQTWIGAASSFLGMWLAMMVAMMLPSLIPILRRYREVVSLRGETRLGWLTLLVGAGYFSIWTLLGLIAFVLGVALARTEMQQPTIAQAIPIAAGAVVLIAGVFQFTSWKLHNLACCANMPESGRVLPANAGTAWRHGLRVGLHCSICCAGLMAVLLAIGVMNLWAMAIIAAVITAERFTRATVRVVRAVGTVFVAGGVLLIARAAGIG